MTAATTIRQWFAVRPARDGSPLLSAAWTVLTVVTALVMIANAAWMATGGHLFVVSTASMSPTTPVGSLVLVRPSASVAIGDVLSFHPYGNPEVTYTHRVVAVEAGPVYTTQGDQSGSADPWPVHPSDIVGTAVAVVPAVGWLVRAFPWLLIGSIISLLLLGMMERRRRLGYAVLAGVVLVCVPLLLWHPLVRGDLVGIAAPRPGELQVKIVNTGLLPVDFSIPSGDQAHAPAGNAVQLTGPVNDRGDLWINALVSLPWWGWAIVVAICLSPLAITTLLGSEETDEDEAAATEAAAIPPLPDVAGA